MTDKVKRLHDLLINSQKTYEQWREILQGEKPGTPEQMRAGVNTVWYDHELFALYASLIENNVQAAKQHFYTCGRLDEYGINKFDAKILDYGVNHLSYALLSDCQPLIERYSRLTHSLFPKMVETGKSVLTYTMQCVLKDDWVNFDRVLDIIKTKGIKRAAGLKLDHHFFEAFGVRDKGKMEEVLAEFVSPKVHKQRNKHEILLNEFISHPALGYAKLAWIKGIEVEVDSPLVPKELLPVRPLTEYIDEYAFLKEAL